MAEAVQACERVPGQDTCPFHPSHKSISLCKTCGFLVCAECMTSKEHKEHEFKKLSECVKEPTNAIARYLTNIDKNLLEAVDQELDAIKNETQERVQKHTDCVQRIKEQGTKIKREIDSTTNDIVVQMFNNLQEVLDSLEKHIQVLESFKIFITEERKKCSKVLQDGSIILKFDVGNEVMEKADKTKIPEHPNISNLQLIECENSKELIRKALGTLQELNLPSTSSTSKSLQHSTEDPKKHIATSDHSAPTQTRPEQEATHKYSSINNQFTWSNNDPEYCQISPLANDIAWAGNNNHSDRLHLINSTGELLHKIQTDKSFVSLSVLPTTGQLYGGFPDDYTIRSIDTESGKTTVIIKCDIIPYRIKVTIYNDVLVGTCTGKCPVYRYKLTGELVHKSPKRYDVYDIEECTRTNRVVLSCDSSGVMILNKYLAELHSFTGPSGLLQVFKKTFECTTAIFDSYGNLIVGDWCNKEIYILDGNQYNIIQKVAIKDISCPTRFKLYDNVLWVQCGNPDKVICIEMK